MPIKGFTGLNVLNGYIADYQVEAGRKVVTGDSVGIYSNKISPTGFPVNTLNSMDNITLQENILRATIDSSSYAVVVFKDNNGVLSFRRSNDTVITQITTDTIGEYEIYQGSAYTYVVFTNITTGKVHYTKIASDNTFVLYETDITGVDINTKLHGNGLAVLSPSIIFILENGLNKKIYKVVYGSSTTTNIDFSFDKVSFGAKFSTSTFQIIYELSGVLYSQRIDSSLVFSENYAVTNESVSIFCGVYGSSGVVTTYEDPVIFVTTLGVMKMSVNTSKVKTFILDSSVNPYTLGCSISNKKISITYFDADGFNVDVYTIKATFEPYQVYNNMLNITMSNVTLTYATQYKISAYIESGTVKTIITEPFNINTSGIALANGNAGDIVPIKVMV